MKNKNDVKLPKPDFRLTWRSGEGRYTVNKPNVGDTDCYTADTVRTLLAGVAPSPRTPTLSQIDTLAKQHAEGYASPHCFTLGVGSLQAIFEVLAAQGSDK